MRPAKFCGAHFNAQSPVFFIVLMSGMAFLEKKAGKSPVQTRFFSADKGSE